MTEFAIRVLINYKEEFKEKGSFNLMQAINLAIKALEVQVGKPLISDNESLKCPTCDTFFQDNEAISRYCFMCGQRIYLEKI